jgi:hypothetical protein
VEILCQAGYSIFKPVVSLRENSGSHLQVAGAYEDHAPVKKHRADMENCLIIYSTFSI